MNNWQNAAALFCFVSISGAFRLSGARLIQLRQVLGPRSLSAVQQRYTHLTDDHAKDIVLRMTSQMLGKDTTQKIQPSFDDNQIRKLASI